MGLETYKQSFLRNDLTAFKLLERIIAAVCITIPVFLRIADTGPSGWRSSISDYVYMDNSQIFGMMLCMASMLFIVNGAVFFKNENKHDLNSNSKWYNIALGLSLLGVIIFPYKQYGAPHFIFAGLFFLGNAIVTVAAARHKKNLPVRWSLGVLTVLFLGVFFANKILKFQWLDWLTLFWAEWLSLTVIGIHFILEARNLQRPPDIGSRK
jgi:hypothetical protein